MIRLPADPLPEVWARLRWPIRQQLHDHLGAELEHPSVEEPRSERVVAALRFAMRACAGEDHDYRQTAIEALATGAEDCCEFFQGKEFRRCYAETDSMNSSESLISDGIAAIWGLSLAQSLIRSLSADQRKVRAALVSGTEPKGHVPHTHHTAPSGERRAPIMSDELPRDLKQATRELRLRLLALLKESNRWYRQPCLRVVGHLEAAHAKSVEREQSGGKLRSLSTSVSLAKQLVLAVTGEPDENALPSDSSLRKAHDRAPVSPKEYLAWLDYGEGDFEVEDPLELVRVEKSDP